MILSLWWLGGVTYLLITYSPATCVVYPTFVKWLLEFLGIPWNFFLGIPRNKGVNFHSKFGLGIPRNSQP